MQIVFIPRKGSALTGKKTFADLNLVDESLFTIFERRELPKCYFQDLLPPSTTSNPWSAETPHLIFALKILQRDLHILNLVLASKIGAVKASGMALAPVALSSRFSKSIRFNSAFCFSYSCLHVTNSTHKKHVQYDHKACLKPCHVLICS